MPTSTNKGAVTPQSCVLSLDESNRNYSAEAADFQIALYDVLAAYADGAGQSAMGLHAVNYPQTGATEISLREGVGSDDQIVCASFPAAGSTDTITCSIVVSEAATMQADSSGKTPAQYFASLSSNAGAIRSEVRAILGEVSSIFGGFKTPGKASSYLAVRTVYSDMNSVALTVSANYAFSEPRKHAGVDGVTVTLSGALMPSSGQITAEQVQVQPYTIAVPYFAAAKNSPTHVQAMRKIQAVTAKAAGTQ
jgi:hypothetical protein